MLMIADRLGRVRPDEGFSRTDPAAAARTASLAGAVFEQKSVVVRALAETEADRRDGTPSASSPA
ncbi:hypothetical protein [Nonomuraea sp. NPDC001699]